MMLALLRRFAPTLRTSAAPEPFSYFDRTDTSLIEAFIEDWRREFPHFTVYGDADVLPILSRLMPGSAELYLALRIPAAKADLARLALLHAHGGLYIDCHCGLQDAVWVRSRLASLSRFEMITVEKPRAAEPDPFFPRHLLNGILFARRSSPVVEDLLRQGLENLVRHLRGVMKGGPPTDYDIWSMFGAYVLTMMVFEPAADFADLRRALRGGRIKIEPMNDVPIKISFHPRRYYSQYAVMHWSKRQGAEPLVDPAQVPSLLQGLGEVAISDI